jgi:hypothetical protein
MTDLGRALHTTANACNAAHGLVGGLKIETIILKSRKVIVQIRPLTVNGQAFEP